MVFFTTEGTEDNEGTEAVSYDCAKSIFHQFHPRENIIITVTRRKN